MILIAVDIIQCPACGELQAGDVTWEPGHPWPTYIHECDCGYVITESEWEVVP